MPATLPISSCSGVTVDSSSSTTRLVFSSTTPVATANPKISNWKYSRPTLTRASAVRCPLSGFGGFSASTVTVAPAVAARSWAGSTPWACSAPFTASCVTAVSSTVRSWPPALRR